MSEMSYASGQLTVSRMMFVLLCTHILLVWLFSPTWLAVLVTVFWLLLFAAGGGSDE